MKYPLIYCILFLLVISTYSCNNSVGPSSAATATHALQNVAVVSLSASGNYLYAGTEGGKVYLSKTSGFDWVMLNTNFFSKYSEPIYDPLYINPMINTMFVDGGDLFVGTGFGLAGGVFLSTDNGSTWSERDNGINSEFSGQNTNIPSVNCFIKNSNYLFAGTDNGVFLSTNNGISWASANTGLSFGNYDSIYGHAPQVTSIVNVGTELFAGTASEGVFRSTNNGRNWNSVDSGLTSLLNYGLAVIGTDIFAGIFQTQGNFSGGVYLSTDYGTSWTAVNNGLTNHMVNFLYVNGSNLFAGTNVGVYFSGNRGANWTEYFAGSALDSSRVSVLLVSGSSLFAGGNGIWRFPL